MGVSRVAAATIADDRALQVRTNADNIPLLAMCKRYDWRMDHERDWIRSLVWMQKMLRPEGEHL